MIPPTLRSLENSIRRTNERISNLKTIVNGLLILVILQVIVFCIVTATLTARLLR